MFLKSATKGKSKGINVTRNEKYGQKRKARHITSKKKNKHLQALKVKYVKFTNNK